jgi:tRNA (cytidine32/guanosine34-2'-O)-methyltransferase
MLGEGGTFVAKFFKMQDLSYLHAMMKQIFKDVYVVKPESSRNTSAEAFVVGLGFMSNGKLVLSESLSVMKQIADTEEHKSEEDDD